MRPVVATPAILLRDFNPRTHVGCDIRIFPFIPFFPYFNPRTHVGCDFARIPSSSCTGISIHAPTWGATYHGVIFGVDDIISIHAPTWGATQGVGDQPIYKAISIHAPTWGATYRSSLLYHQTSISIHAPTWGATHTQVMNYVTSNDFNPRTHVGCDICVTTRLPSQSRFQSTHPRGVRLRFTNISPNGR